MRVRSARSNLSPCVLPLMPASLVGATTQHLQGSLALSFAGIGPCVGTIGSVLGELRRTVSRQGHSIEREPHRPLCPAQLLI
jgi:cytochrome c biogenesis protein CcdA